MDYFFWTTIAPIIFLVGMVFFTMVILTMLAIMFREPEQFDHFPTSRTTEGKWSLANKIKNFFK